MGKVVVSGQDMVNFFKIYNELNKSVCNGFQIAGYTPQIRVILKDLVSKKDKLATLMYHESTSTKASDGILGVLTCSWKIRRSVRCGAVYSEVHLSYFKDYQSPSEYDLAFLSQEVVK